jgi:8-oxo-dGTP diphosphatase
MLPAADDGDRIVAAAAIVADGRLLAARRRQPVVAGGGGRWELPGGKVEAGESPAQALRREIAEELGCSVEVGQRLAGQQRLAVDTVLHAYRCTLDGATQPQPTEHDAVRWLSPEELDEVHWLAADQPFVTALREQLEDGERLPGGNVGGAVRIGPTVRRPTGPWTPAVHALLRHVADAGLDGVPRVLGFDARGREVLAYAEGRAGAHFGERASDAVVRRIGAWLARYHAAVADFVPPSGSVWRTVDREAAAGEIVCHHDVAPYNVVVVDDRIVAVIDWDMAGPGTTVQDLAYAAWNCVPLNADCGDDESARRLLVLCEGYASAGAAVDAAQVLRAVVSRMVTALDRITAGQAAGDAGMLNLRAVGEPERTRHAVEMLRRRVGGIERSLHSLMAGNS